MKEWNEAKADYEAVPIPRELPERVQAGIRQGRANRRRNRLRRWSAAAACFVVLVGVLNLSPQAAAAAAEVPVLGGLFRVLTVRSFEKEEDGIRYDVSVPEVEAGDSALAEEINRAIQARVDQHLARAQQDWADYREAFFATGGTEAEWGDREMNVMVDYTVHYQSGSRVSFVVSFSEGWVSSMEERYCYTLDLAENRSVTLQDLLGESWKEICDEAIRTQIEASRDADGFTYFFPEDQGGFTGVDENTAFYLREDGVPVVVFPRYAIAAGAAGFPEFPIEP